MTAEAPDAPLAVDEPPPLAHPDPTQEPIYWTIISTTRGPWALPEPQQERSE